MMSNSEGSTNRSGSSTGTGEQSTPQSNLMAFHSYQGQTTELQKQAQQYYTSSTSSLRDSDTKKLPPLGMTLMNNLFATFDKDPTGSVNQPPSTATSGPGAPATLTGSQSQPPQLPQPVQPSAAHSNPLFTLANSVPHYSNPGATTTLHTISVPPGAPMGDPNATAVAAAASMGQYASAPSPKSQRKFLCNYPNCGKTFSRRMNLKSHIASEHQHKKPFQCSVCQRTFARHSDRRRHENNQHKAPTGFVCGGIGKDGQSWGCGKVFKRKDGLIAHWRSQKARKKCLKSLPVGVQLDQLDKDLGMIGGQSI